jgi:predicted permease
VPVGGDGVRRTVPHGEPLRRGEDSAVLDTLVKLLPALLGIAVGYLLRRRGIADERDADFMFALIVNAFLPALAFTSLSRVQLDRQLAIFPLAALVIIAGGHVAGRVMAAKGPFIGVQEAVVICCCMNVNSGFVLSFVQGLFGAEGVARIAAFDAVNTTLTFTWTAYVAARGNPRYSGASPSLMLGRFAKSPPLYGIAAGLLVSGFGLHVPAAISDPLATFGTATGVLMAIGVGIRFEVPGRRVGKAALVFAARVTSGLAVAGAFVLIFGLTGMDRTVMLLLGVAPTPFIIVPFATMENLDVRLTVNTLSVSMLASLPLAIGVILLTT